MFDLVSYIGSSYVIVEPLRIVLNNNFTLTLRFVLPFYEFLLNVIIAKRFHKRTKFFLLVVPSRPSRIHKNRRTHDCSQHLRFFKFALVDVQYNQQVEVDPFVIVCGRAELNCTKIDLPVYHLHLAFSPDAYIN